MHNFKFKIILRTRKRGLFPFVRTEENLGKFQTSRPGWKSWSFRPRNSCLCSSPRPVHFHTRRSMLNEISQTTWNKGRVRFSLASYGKDTLLEYKEQFDPFICTHLGICFPKVFQVWIAPYLRQFRTFLSIIMFILETRSTRYYQ